MTTAYEAFRSAEADKITKAIFAYNNPSRETVAAYRAAQEVYVDAYNAMQRTS